MTIYNNNLCLRADDCSRNDVTLVARLRYGAGMVLPYLAMALLGVRASFRIAKEAPSTKHAAGNGSSLPCVEAHQLTIVHLSFPTMKPHLSAVHDVEEEKEESEEHDGVGRLAPGGIYQHHKNRCLLYLTTI